MRGTLANFAFLTILFPSLSYSQTDTGSLSDSANARLMHKIGVGLGLGTIVSPVTGGGLALHYSYTPLLQFEVAAYSGTSDGKSLVTGSSSPYLALDKFDINASYTFLGLKYFPGNSFYVAGGLGRRTIDFDLAAHTLLMPGNLNMKLKTTSIVLRVAIGNIWSFDSGFYIGGEWLAIALPLSSKVSNSTTATGADSAETTKLNDDSIKTGEELGKTTSVGAMFHTGWQF